MKSQSHVDGQLLKDKLDSLVAKLCLIFYFSGGYFYRSKDFNSTILCVQRNHPQLFKKDEVIFDGRFFGLISSNIEKALLRIREEGLIEGYSYRLPKQPIHTIRSLTSVGSIVAVETLDDSNVIEQCGLKDRIPQFSADILSMSAFSTPLSTAYAFYLSTVEKGKEHDNNVGAVTEVVENEAWPAIVYDRIHYAILERMGKIQSEDDAVICHSFNNYGTHAEILYEIKEDAVRDRYDYLTITADRCHELGEIIEGSSAMEILEKSIIARVPSQVGEDRLYKIRELVQNYPEIPQLFVQKVKSCLKSVNDNLQKIVENGYDWTFTRLERIAKLSKTTPLKTIVTFGPNYTSYKVRAPPQIKDDLRLELRDQKWHFGMDYHINHVPQFAEASLFLEKDYKEILLREKARRLQLASKAL